MATEPIFENEELKPDDDLLKRAASGKSGFIPFDPSF
ncbi:hypothetical protein M2120_001141 [Aurantimicrobium minutum]|nr:hypothetical protein [Aurantimicrobium minutum]